MDVDKLCASILAIFGFVFLVITQRYGLTKSGAYVSPMEWIDIAKDRLPLDVIIAALTYVLALKRLKHH